MNGFGILFSLVLIVWLFRSPMRSAALPFVVASLYITFAEKLEVAGLNFTVIRLLILAGGLRVICRGESLSGGMNGMDRLMLCWLIWNVCSLVGHKWAVLQFRLGTMFDIAGLYYLFRVFVRSPRDVRDLFRSICWLIVPLAVSMLFEKLKGVNPLAQIGFAPLEVEGRDGVLRAKGAFGHPILAGTMGALCLPIAMSFWRHERRVAFWGIAASLAILFASGSSGPIIVAMCVTGGMFLWRFRANLSLIRWGVVLMLIALEFVMNDPVYFLAARIDFMGGSTGYFRAQLIRSSMEHLNEWWLIGTDVTRHWMPSGIAANADHTDMTNYFLQMGVWGGLPLMLLFGAVLVAGFRRLGQALRVPLEPNSRDPYLIWTLGVILFGHAVTFLSISYYDQSVAFLCLALASVNGMPVTRAARIKDFVANRYGLARPMTALETGRCEQSTSLSRV